MESKGKRLVIIDSHALIHRAYHALPPLTTKKGEIVNAVYGFLLVFLKTVKELQPEFIAATFDSRGPCFRHKMFKEYKAKRQRAPEELYQQIPKVKEVLSAFQIPIFEKEGYEADDLIATIAKKSVQEQYCPNIENYILTGDLDALQLINNRTKVLLMGRGLKETVIYDKKKLEEKYGLLPKQVVDFKALAGDPSDNIPGAVGIGKKTAVELLQKFGSVENLYQTIEKGEAWELKTKTKDILLKNKEQVFLSYGLAETKTDASIDFNLEKCRWQGFNKEEVAKVLKKFEFYTLLKRI